MRVKIAQPSAKTIVTQLELVGKCGQCHIDSRGTRLNTDYTLA